MSIPEKTEADVIVANCRCFLCSETEVAGQDGKLYKLATYSYVGFPKVEQFRSPLPDVLPGVSAFEMRGLAFVHNPETEEWKRFLALPKFFNLDENDDNLQTELADTSLWELISIQPKKDGSLVNVVVLPDGTIRCKSKMSLDSTHARMATGLVSHNADLSAFIRTCVLTHGLSPIFELVGPDNLIVVQYEVNELVLIQVRDNTTGRFLTFEEIRTLDPPASLKLAEPLHHEQPAEPTTLKQIAEDWCVSVVKEEGWVVGLRNVQSGGTKLVKVKTDWYHNEHRHQFRDTWSCVAIAEAVLAGTADDTVSELRGPQRAYWKEWMEKLPNLVQQQQDKMLKNLPELNESKGAYATRMRNAGMFGTTAFKLLMLLKADPETDFTDVDGIRVRIEKMLQDFFLGLVKSGGKNLKQVLDMLPLDSPEVWKKAHADTLWEGQTV
eukprot:TRINITY_DN47248_c0_g2_i1.p1 TRINITY_DN47248_c0_g2~~TRINITY_DN47248_c0_g2_i1.p1  ORF type:complete len:439 (-),score=51.75 TRINITY_DN47248_c0_g2_i1:192-1508(-)